MTPVMAQAPAAGVSEKDQSLLDRIVARQAEVASRYQPVMSFDDLIARYDLMRSLKDRVLFEGEDYVKIPGVEKPFLSKAGAQKLCMFFGYCPEYELLTGIEDWTGSGYEGEPLFYYKFRCVIKKDGNAVGEGIGSANSWESKYRFRWIGREDAQRFEDWEKFPTRGGSIFEPEFAINKAETSGKYGKPLEYWTAFANAIANGTARKIMRKKKDGGDLPGWEIDATLYRVPNDQFPDVINTCQKQAEKRSMVEAVLSATGLSELFTQDEDSVGEEGMRGATGARPEPTPSPVAQKRIAEETARLEAQRKAAAAEEPLDIAKMVKGFEALKERLGPYTAVYYAVLKNFGIKHSNELRDKDKAKACYREMETQVKKYEAERDADMSGTADTADTAPAEAQEVA